MVDQWKPRSGEEVVEYDPAERSEYEAGRSSVYDQWAWPQDLRVGRNKHGCFPEVCARAHYERLGYRVWLSEPQYPDEAGFVLFHYRGMRRDKHRAFQRMVARLPGKDVDHVAELAHRAKQEAGLSGGGGDPDLFVFHPETDEQFFVEVKDEDELHLSQHVCFPIIEFDLGVEVRVARLVKGGPVGRDI